MLRTPFIKILIFQGERRSAITFKCSNNMKNIIRTCVEQVHSGTLTCATNHCNTPSTMKQTENRVIEKRFPVLKDSQISGSQEVIYDTNTEGR